MPSKPSAEFQPAPHDAPLQLLDAAAVEYWLDPQALIDGLEAGFRALELGEVQAPPRSVVRMADRGFSLTMSAWQSGMQLAVKTINVFESNRALGRPSHVGTVTLFDPEHGSPTCVMDAASITALRTAAAAALSIRMLARPDARVVMVVGGGVQARAHCRMLPLVGRFERIRLWSRNPEAAREIAARVNSLEAVDNLEAAVQSADVVCLCTGASQAVIRQEWIRPGTHVTSVGYAPPGSELPRELITGATLFVETQTALQPPPVGCAELAGVDPSGVTPIGAVSLGRRPGRVDQRQVTLYKAMGNAMEDMVAANLVYRRSRPA